MRFYEEGVHGRLQIHGVLTTYPQRAVKATTKLRSHFGHDTVANRLSYFHFWCLQSNRSRRGFSSRKAAWSFYISEREDRYESAECGSFLWSPL